MRASELVNLHVNDLDLHSGTICCRRAKGSLSSLDPIKPGEVVALEKMLRERKCHRADYAFHSEHSEKMSRSPFWRVVTQASDRVAWGWTIAWSGT